MTFLCSLCSLPDSRCSHCCYTRPPSCCWCLTSMITAHSSGYPSSSLKCYTSPPPQDISTRLFEVSQIICKSLALPDQHWGDTTAVGSVLAMPPSSSASIHPFHTALVGASWARDWRWTPSTDGLFEYSLSIENLYAGEEWIMGLLDFLGNRMRFLHPRGPQTAGGERHMKIAS